MEKFNSTKHALLRQIADTLGMPVECFFVGPPSPRLVASADECLRLWSEIRTEEGRQQALSALQAIAKLETR